MLTNWTLSALQVELDALSLQGEGGIQLGPVCTDTRTLKPGDLFVALQGPNFNGDLFVEQAQKSGASAAIVSELQPVNLPQLVVPDTRIALGRLAALHRQAFTGPVVAITGSSGKTSVKEMLANILAQQASVLATRGNLNNHIGAPLTLLSLAPEHQYAVIELGASARGEIAYTTALTQPDVAILNNAAAAHLEGFGSLQAVVEAKAEIFSGLTADGVAVVNLDDPHADYWLNLLEGRKLRTFSTSSSLADIYAAELETASNGCCSFTLHSLQGEVDVDLQVLGVHMVANALAAASAAEVLGISLEQIASGLSAYTGVAGRLAVQTGYQGAQIIDDSYNANPESVKAAIRVLASLPGKRLLVLGNMAELGDDAEALHADLGDFAAEQQLDGVWTVGALAAHTAEAFARQRQRKVHAFASKQALLDALQPKLNATTSVLVKGSRSAAMEQVVNGLTLKG